jgi:hypothetical protein
MRSSAAGWSWSVSLRWQGVPLLLRHIDMARTISIVTADNRAAGCAGSGSLQTRDIEPGKFPPRAGAAARRWRFHQPAVDVCSMELQACATKRPYIDSVSSRGPVCTRNRPACPTFQPPAQKSFLRRSTGPSPCCARANPAGPHFIKQVPLNIAVTP